MAERAVPLRNRRVLVDSSAYLALLDRDDEHHSNAIAILQGLASGHFRQITTNAMLIEAHVLILSVLGNALANQFLREMAKSNTSIIRVRASDEQRATQILFRYTDKDFSFNDAISFAVMEWLGLSLAFTFDRHFSQYGLSVVSLELLSAEHLKFGR